VTKFQNVTYMPARNFEIRLNFIFEIRLPESIFIFQEIELFSDLVHTLLTIFTCNVY